MASEEIFWRSPEGDREIRASRAFIGPVGAEPPESALTAAGWTELGYVIEDETHQWRPEFTEHLNEAARDVTFAVDLAGADPFVPLVDQVVRRHRDLSALRRAEQTIREMIDATATDFHIDRDGTVSQMVNLVPLNVSVESPERPTEAIQRMREFLATVQFDTCVVDHRSAPFPWHFPGEPGAVHHYEPRDEVRLAEVLAEYGDGPPIYL